MTGAESVLSHSPAGPHRIALRVWGPREAPRTAVCVHGLTGCARDFDALAAALVAVGYRVVCPDVVGRGDSDHLADRESYQLRQYVKDAHVLLDRVGAAQVDWIGTSMGGIIGMAVAASHEPRVRRLVLNDIGPFVPTEALQRLGATLGTDPRFPDLASAASFLRETRAQFGNLTDEQWTAMAERTTRAADDGGHRLHYDPGIAGPFKRTMHEDIDLWRLWDAIECPVLVLRGRASDLLLAETADEMTRRGPRASLIEFSDCGHNPPLLDPVHIAPVVEWLGPADEA